MPDHPISDELVRDIVLHLELGVRGGVPSPEFAAQLLRRLTEEILGKDRPQRTG